jgi:hypothetical protein
MDELLITYYPWLDPGGAGPADNRPRREPAPAAPAAAGGIARPRPPVAGGGAPARRRWSARARQSGDSLLPLLFAA